MQDLRFAVRQLRKTPGFTAVVVLTLAVAIGANTAIFSLIHSALLQPLPYPDAGQLVDVMEAYAAGKPNGSVSGGAFKDWREHSQKFTALAVYSTTTRNLTGSGTPERANGLAASAEFLAVLGVAPELGRWFSPDETRPGGNPRVVLLTDAFWRARFGADPGALGRTLLLDQVPHTIIGVLPPRAWLDDSTQLVTPDVIDGPDTYWGRDAHWRRVVGRLRPGVTPGEAQTELCGIKQRLNALYPSWKQTWSVIVTPLQEIYVGATRPMFMLLLGAVGMVLLIACANVSNLLLARGHARAREVAVRMALGAHPWRIVRQTLIESSLIAAGGCVLGGFVAAASLRVLTHLVAAQLPQALQPQLNLAVLTFSVVVAGGCGLITGLLPAWRAMRIDAMAGLKESEHGSASRAGRRTQSLVVVAEFALTLVLLVSAGLFLRSFARLLAVDPGFNPRSTLVFDLSFPRKKYATDDAGLRFTKTIIERLRALPGVEAVGAGSSLPLSGMERGEFLSRADRPEPENRYSVGVSSVSGDYFAAAGIAVLRGRVFTEADNTRTAPPTVVIDGGVVRDLFPGEDPIGRQMRFLGKTCEVIGVVGRVHQRGFDQDPRPWVYGPQAHFPTGPSIVIRSQVAPASLVAAVRAAISAIDPEQPIANVRTLEEAVHRSVAGRRTGLMLLGVFAVIAIGLACMGMYAVIAHAIGQRTREFSIRSALGAQRTDIVRLVIIGALQPSGIGIALGLLAALTAGRVFQNQLFQVKAHDPWVFAGSIGLLLLAASASTLPAARRAASVSPTESLRAE